VTTQENFVRIDVFRKVRKALNLSQRDLAYEANVCPATVAKIELGHAPKLSVLFALATAMHIDYRDLLVQPSGPFPPVNDALCKSFLHP
jgi:transcriptional regulator with XRE-family HTH domain